MHRVILRNRTTWESHRRVITSHTERAKRTKMDSRPRDRVSIHSRDHPFVWRASALHEHVGRSRGTQYGAFRPTGGDVLRPTIRRVGSWRGRARTAAPVCLMHPTRIGSDRQVSRVAARQDVPIRRPLRSTLSCYSLALISYVLVTQAAIHPTLPPVHDLNSRDPRNVGLGLDPDE